MRPPASLHESRVSGPQNFRTSVQNEFCNSIPRKTDVGRYSHASVCRPAAEGFDSDFSGGTFPEKNRAESKTYFVFGAQERTASISSPSSYVARIRASSSINTTTSTARQCLSAPASLAAKASCPSGSARPTARSDRRIGSRSRTRRHQQCSARLKRIGVDSGRPLRQCQRCRNNAAETADADPN